MKVHQHLLTKGYFPKELPPVFTTQDFGTYIDDILGDWRSDKVFKLDTKSLGKLPGKKLRRGSYTYELLPAEPETISKPKRGYERRDVHITHPLPQALLSLEIGNHWRSIQRWLSRQTFSEDEIRVGPDFPRSIKGINFLAHEAKKAYLQASSDWVVKTDITRFYPSIYTHSIAWAAYGKENVKNNLTLYKGSLADRMDLLTRSCNRNQTVGIPVGPETSRIIAEVISSRIDSEYAGRSHHVLADSVDRLQDDWTVGTSSLEEAERVLSSISGIYRGYGLDINGSKTSIDRIVSERQSAWKSDMASFLSHRQGVLAGARLREFLELTLVLQSQNASAAVVSYALSVVEAITITPRDIPAIESFLIKAAMVSPMSLERICRVILDIQSHTSALSAKRIGERFMHLVEVALDKSQSFEVIWLLYTLRGLKRPIDIRPLHDRLALEPGSSIALILLDMKSKGLCIGKLPISAWQSRITNDSIHTDWTWLLAYEGYRHGWLTDHLGLMSGSLFRPMASRGVVFYDPTRNISRSDKERKSRLIKRQQDMQEVRAMLENLRGIDIDHYQ